MEIHEITKPKEPMNEIVGGLARMAGQAIAQSRPGQAVGRALGTAGQGFGQSLVGQTLQKAGDVERAAQVSGNTKAVSDAALKQWNNKVIQLTQALGGQPIDPAEYESHLRDFVQRVMLRNNDINDLEPQSLQRINQAISGVVQGRNDRKTLDTAFQGLVQQALVARLDPKKIQIQTPVTNPQQAVKAALQNVNTNTIATQLQQQAGGPQVVRSTNNAMADELLRQLGITVQ